MGKKSPSAPPMPDYKGAAEATAQSNLDAMRAATAANRVNQVTPWGTLTYSQSPRKFNQAGYDAAMQAYNSQQAQAPQVYTGRPLSSARSQSEWQQIKSDMERANAVPQGGMMKPPSMDDFYEGQQDGGWTAEVKLSPEQQALLDLNNKLSLQSGNLAGGYLNSLGANGKSAADIGYKAIMDRLNPQLEAQRKAFDAQMANQGIALGSEAYNNAFKNQSQSENDARIQAGLQGIGIGNQTLANQMNIINSLRGGSQVTPPSFINTPQQGASPGVDYNQVAGLQNQYNMGLYNSKVAQNNNMLGMLGGLGGAALGNIGAIKGLF